MAEYPTSEQQALKNERWELLRQINVITDRPLIALSLVWLVLLILDFTTGLSPVLQTISTMIWVLFVLDFLIEFTIAPHKLDYLRQNWLTVISLLLPALRVLRIFRALRILRLARAARSVSLIRVITSLNRGMRALSKTLGRRGVGYVVALTMIVTLGGAAGMYAFESPRALCEATNAGVEAERAREVCAGSADGADVQGLSSYSEAVWWTSMIMTTMGSEYWPVTVEGRILGWLLSLYAFAIFGYITATIASYFVSQDAAAQPLSSDAESVPTSPDALRSEIMALRLQVAALVQQLDRLEPTRRDYEHER